MVVKMQASSEKDIAVPARIMAGASRSDGPTELAFWRASFASACPRSGGMPRVAAISCRPK